MPAHAPRYQAGRGNYGLDTQTMSGAALPSNRNDILLKVLVLHGELQNVAASRLTLQQQHGVEQRGFLPVTLRYTAFLSYTLYIADCSTDHYTETGNEYSTPSKRTLKDCETGEGMQDIGPVPTGRVVALPWHQNNSTSLVSIGFEGKTIIIIRP